MQCPSRILSIPIWRKASIVACIRCGDALEEMGAAHDRVDLLGPGELHDIAGRVDHPGMSAAEEDDDPLGDPEEDSLVVRDKVGCLHVRVKIDESAYAGVLEIGRSRHLAGDHDPFPYKRGHGRLMEVTGLAAQRIAGDPVLFAENPLATLEIPRGEGGRVDEQVDGAARLERLLEPTGVVEVAVADDDGVELREIDLHSPGVLEQGPSAAGVEEDAVLARLDEKG